MCECVKSCPFMNSVYGCFCPSRNMVAIMKKDSPSNLDKWLILNKQQHTDDYVKVIIHHH